jgi:hypothetical protein
LSPGALRVPNRLGKAGGSVGRHVGVNAGAVLVERRFDIHDCWQRRVLDLDESRCILGAVAAVGHDERHHLADEADLVAREGALGTGSGERGMGNEKGSGSV